MLLLIPIVFAATDGAALVTAISASVVAIITALTSLIVLFTKLTKAEKTALEAKQATAEIKINVDGNLAAQIERADKLTAVVADLASRGLDYATEKPSVQG